MEDKSLFPSFEKMYKRIPASYFEVGAFALLETMIALLLVEQVTVLFWAKRCYDFLFFAVGGLMIPFALLYLGSWLLWRDKRGFRELLVTDLAFGFFLLWCGLATVFSENPSYSLMGSEYRKEGFITYLIYAAVLICARAVRSSRHQRILLWSLAGTGCLLSVFTFLQSEPALQQLLALDNIFRGGHWLVNYTSVFSNSNHFAYFLTMVLLALAGLALYAKGTGQKLAVLLFIFISVILGRNNTLGCILAVAVGMVFLGAVMLACDRKRFAKCVALLIVYVCAVSVTLWFNATIVEDFQEIYDALNNSSETMTSSSERLLMWRESLQQIAQTPILGVGLEGGDVIAFTGGNDRPHNEYIQHALFTGIPGAIAYLTALISLFLCCMRNLRKLPVETLILGTMVVGYCASAFVGNSMYYTTVYFVMILGLIMGTVNDTGKMPEKFRKTDMD